MISSTMPSAKYSCSGSPLIFVKASTAIDGLSGNGRGFACCPARETARQISVARPIGPQHKCLNRSRDILQTERPKLLERQAEPIPHMISNWSRNADTARRTLSLKSCCHIHRVSVQVSAIGNRVAKVDPDPKANGPIGSMVSVLRRNLVLDFHGAAHCPVNAVEHNEQGIPAGLNDPATVLFDGGIDQVPTQCSQSLKRPHVIEADKPAVARHIGIQHGDQLPSIWPSYRV